MRTGIVVETGAADRTRTEMIVADRNNRQKHVRRAEIVLLTVRRSGPCGRREEAVARAAVRREGFGHAWPATMTEHASDFDTSCPARNAEPSGWLGMRTTCRPPQRAVGRGPPVPSPAEAAFGVRWPRQRWRSRLLVPPWDPYGSDRRLACPFRRGARHETNDDLGLGPASPDRRWGGGAAARLLPRSRAVAGAAEPGPGRVPELGRAADRCSARCPRPAAPPRAGGRARGAAAGATAAAITGNDAGKGAAAGAVGGAAAQRGARRQDRRQATAQQQQAGAAFGRATAACMQGRGYTGG